MSKSQPIGMIKQKRYQKAERERRSRRSKSKGYVHHEALEFLDASFYDIETEERADIKLETFENDVVPNLNEQTGRSNMADKIYELTKWVLKKQQGEEPQLRAKVVCKVVGCKFACHFKKYEDEKGEMMVKLTMKKCINHNHEL